MQFIATPVPEFLATLQDRHINHEGFVDAHVPKPDGQGTVLIEAFDTSVDRFVSGSLNRGTGWETDRVNHVYQTWVEAGKKGNFLDAGANIGTWSLPLAAAFHGKSMVVAIEAMPPIADHFRAGIVANRADNIIFLPYAIGQPRALDDVELALNPTNKGGSTVVGNKPWTNRAEVQTYTVGLTTIDSIMHEVSDMANILYAKFDIEGNEGRAIEGGPEFFKNTPPCVLFMELNPAFLQSAGTSRAAIESELAKFGYNTAKVSALGNFNVEYRQTNFQACLNRLK